MDSPAQRVDVSAEMVTFIGPGSVRCDDLPDQSAMILVSLEQTAQVDMLRRVGSSRPIIADRTILLAVMRSALVRLFGWRPDEESGQAYFLDGSQASIAARLLEVRENDGATHTYRLAKSIELICELAPALRDGKMVPLLGEGPLSRRDLERLAAARRMIDNQWSEKLTIDAIARACALNRSKLTRGFREIYGCSVSEALSERRLIEARRQLLITDLPVGVIGYRSGYSNNASFTRAFGRRFGVSPSDFRNVGAMA